MKKSIKRQLVESTILMGCAIGVSIIVDIRDKQGNKIINDKAEKVLTGVATTLAVTSYTKLSIARFRIIKRIFK